MRMRDILHIDNDVSIDEKIKNRNWETRIEGSSIKYRVNSNGELQSYSMEVKDDVTIKNESDTKQDNIIESNWVTMTDYSGVVHLKDVNHVAELHIKDGYVKDTRYRLLR